MNKIEEEMARIAKKAPKAESEPKAGSKLGCLTIASKNYLASARVLLSTFKEHHPDAQLFLLLVDEVDGYFDPANEPYELLTLRDIDLPWPEVFPFHYSVLELNTAVKPFALETLLRSRGLDQIIYLDPDIWVLRRFNAVLDLLDEGHSIVLTPHIFEPYNDDKKPTELNILQSGTYNLGYIGMRACDATFKMLSWWQEKNELDCVVDIPRGLFVDQKWMDLVPGYFEGAAILRDPTYNVAYWNLHERKLSLDNNTFKVNGEDLTFFHFSGYSPDAPLDLSKHQNRHVLSELPILNEICTRYGDKLIEAEYHETKEFPYAFATLDNGIPVTAHMYLVLRTCIRRGIPFPSPKANPDAFCRFLLRRNNLLDRGTLPPLLWAVLVRRQDVKDHFAEGIARGDLSGLINWVCQNGVTEERLGLLIKSFGKTLTETSVVDRIAAIVDRRTDLKRHFAAAFTAHETFVNLIKWLANFGIKEEGIAREEIEAFIAAKWGPHKVMNVFFNRWDLRNAFAKFQVIEDLESMVRWFEDNGGYEEGVTYDEVRFFVHWLRANPDYFRDNMFAYFERNHERASIPNYFTLAINGRPVDANSASSILATKLDPLVGVESYYCFDSRNAVFFPKLFENAESLRNFATAKIVDRGMRYIQSPALVRAVRSRLREYLPHSDGVNVVGYHRTPTGMGESARSMCRTLESIGKPIRKISLPNKVVDENDDSAWEMTKDPLAFGWHEVAYRSNIVVANADAVESARGFLPHSFWADRNTVGYWVWETENFPEEFSDHLGFKEIWTPSEYSRAAILQVAKVPVRVLPHLLDFKLLDSIQSNRSRFKLPEGAFLVGYFFDVNSVIERKNPLAAIKAFRRAFGGDKNAYLVLKANGARGYSRELARLRNETAGMQNVIWITRPLGKVDTLTLLKSLNVYLSLHRSEGFGLVPAEAIALGVPTIASGYSGNLEFMDEASNLLVDTKRVATERNYGPYKKGSIWGDPSTEHAAELLIAMKDENRRQESIDRASAKLHSTIGLAPIRDLASHAMQPSTSA